jgi:hypothetical protein
MAPWDRKAIPSSNRKRRHMMAVVDLDDSPCHASLLLPKIRAWLPDEASTLRCAKLLRGGSADYGSQDLGLI